LFPQFAVLNKNLRDLDHLHFDPPARARGLGRGFGALNGLAERRFYYRRQSGFPLCDAVGHRHLRDDGAQFTHHDVLDEQVNIAQTALAVKVELSGGGYRISNSIDHHALETQWDAVLAFLSQFKNGFMFGAGNQNKN
jgi:hypothetical protein